jgi:hypothetical protein
MKLELLIDRPQALPDHECSTVTIKCGPACPLTVHHGGSSLSLSCGNSTSPLRVSNLNEITCIASGTWIEIIAE